MAFPDGAVITHDQSTLIVAESYGSRLTAFDIETDGGLSGRRVWAETPGEHPDGICLDSEGSVWYADVGTERCVHVREGGEILDTIELDRGCFACALGGPDNRTLFIVADDWPPGKRRAHGTGVRSSPRRARSVTDPRALGRAVPDWTYIKPRRK